MSSAEITLSWSPPHKSEKHGTILSYIVYCSSQRLGEAIIRPRTIFSSAANETSTTILSGLHPFTTYNCCVSATNDQGRGKLACQSFVTEESGNRLSGIYKVAIEDFLLYWPYICIYPLLNDASHTKVCQAVILT